MNVACLHSKEPTQVPWHLDTIARNVVLTMLRITYRHGRYRRMHRNGWRIGHRSSCCSRSCPLCYQTVCPPRTLYTWCRRNKPHASVYPCTTDPEIQYSIALALRVFFFFFIFFFSLQLIFLSSILNFCSLKLLENIVILQLFHQVQLTNYCSVSRCVKIELPKYFQIHDFLNKYRS